MATKNTPEKCGVYFIEAPNGNLYIGSSINVHDRLTRHKGQLKQNKHPNQILQRAWNKYNDLLEFKQVLVCAKDQLLFYEQLLIDNYKPKYNIVPLAGNTSGYKHTEETKVHLSKIKKNRVLSEEHRKNIGKAGLGRKNSSESIERMRQAALNRWKNSSCEWKRASNGTFA